MLNRFLCLTVALVALMLFDKAPAQSGNDIITDLSQQIERADTAENRARLLAYRARNYLKARDLERAEQDYIASLKLDSKGQIWAELAKLYTDNLEFNSAKKVLNIIDRNFPALKNEVTPLRVLVDEQLRIAYLKEHPPEIIMDTAPDPKRKTRFDIMREVAAQGVVAQASGDDYHALCEQKWGTNYEMLEYCLDQQKTAKNSVARSPRDEIYRQCSEKWGNNYEMIDYCIGNQTTAKNNLRRKYRASGDKVEECKRKWGTNYEMVEYCMKN